MNRRHILNRQASEEREPDHAQELNDRFPSTDEEITAAAHSDPDNPPMTEADSARWQVLPQSRSTRRRLGFTQEEFAAAYGIPLGTLRDWEQCRTQPDAAARTYLQIIAAEPQLLRDIVARIREQREAARAAIR